MFKSRKKEKKGKTCSHFLMAVKHSPSRVGFVFISILTVNGYIISVRCKQYNSYPYTSTNFLSSFPVSILRAMSKKLYFTRFDQVCSLNEFFFFYKKTVYCKIMAGTVFLLCCPWNVILWLLKHKKNIPRMLLFSSQK